MYKKIRIIYGKRTRFPFKGNQKKIKNWKTFQNVIYKKKNTKIEFNIAD